MPLLRRGKRRDRRRRRVCRPLNHAGELWAVCAVHEVRWYVTRELSLVDRNERLEHPDPGAASKLPEVDGIFRSKR